MNLIVTGGVGFIGSAMIRHLVAAAGWHVVNLDKHTYAGNLDSIAPIAGSPRYRLARFYICDQTDMRWHLENKTWNNRVLSDAYRTERLGSAASP